MRTIIIKKIDGIDVVVGFRKLQINPIETVKRTNEKIRKNKISEKIKTASREFLKLKEKGLQNEEEGRSKLSEIKSLREQLLAEMNANNDHMVYFEPKVGEVAVSESEFAEYKDLLIKAKAKSCYLNIDKKEIINNKNKSYFLVDNGKLKRSTINKLGVDFPQEAFFDATNEQLLEVEENEHVENILKLSVEEKKKEYGHRKIELIERVRSKEVELMLDGKTEPEATAMAIEEFRPKLEKLKQEYSQV